ncbi:MAG: alpha/beta hydrolase [Thermoanaerobaculia bacterium]|nr:alpha/beta hydrolase [Thermoanaerobaculia bacterium]
MTNRSPIRVTLCLLLASFTALATFAEGVPEAKTGTLTTSDGNAMIYEVRGSGEPTLVFVHCWACNREDWREQVDVFAQDHRVVTFDLPGHGESGAERESWTLDGLAADTVQLVEELNLKDFVFVGHSMGGPVALLAAARLAASKDHATRGVVCVDTLHDLEMKPPEEELKAWIDMFESDFEGSLAGMMAATLPGEHNEALRAAITEVALASDRRAVLGLMKDFPSLDLVAEAEKASVPIRCINAALMQQNMPADALERNQQHADYELTLMEGVGHFLQLENPSEFNEAFREVLAALTPR